MCSESIRNPRRQIQAEMRNAKSEAGTVNCAALRGGYRYRCENVDGWRSGAMTPDGGCSDYQGPRASDGTGRPIEIVANVVLARRITGPERRIAGSRRLRRRSLNEAAAKASPMNVTWTLTLARGLGDDRLRGCAGVCVGAQSSHSPRSRRRCNSGSMVACIRKVLRKSLRELLPRWRGPFESPSLRSAGAFRTSFTNFSAGWRWLVSCVCSTSFHSTARALGLASRPRWNRLARRHRRRNNYGCRGRTRRRIDGSDEQASVR